MSMINDLITEIYKELCQRGFDVEIMEMLPCIFHQSSYQTTIQFWIDNDDEDSWNGARICSTRIMMDNELTLTQRLWICNHFNKQAHYCSASLSDDDNEFFMVSTCIPIKCDNFVEICADMFEEIINETEFLIDLIESVQDY